MKKILTAAAILVCATSLAQNLNPTVEVTNIYQGNPSEVHKPQAKMAIPDSLMRFDMDFGYEVFEKPYQGAYNFKPYQLAMRPDKDAYRGKKLYLKAGAGYSLHPQLNFVFSPEQAGPFQMSVYANHGSYFGKYNVINHSKAGDYYKLDKVPGKSFYGHDALTRAGFDGRYNFKSSILSLGIGYYGLMTKDTLLNRSYNAADFNIRYSSNRDDDKYIFYDVALNGRLGSDRLNYTGKKDFEEVLILPQPSGLPLYDGGLAKLNENLFQLRANAGPVLSRAQRILVGLEGDVVSYGGDLLSGRAGRIAFVPKYQYKSGNWDLSLGLKIEKIFHGKQADTVNVNPVFSKKGSLIYPDVHVGYRAADNVLIYANLTGGGHLNTYSSLLASNHHFNPSYHYSTYRSSLQLLDNTIEKINFKAGVKGNLGSMLQFEVDGGVAKIDNGFLDSPLIMSPYKIGSVYADYSLVFADVLLGLETGGFDFDAGLHLRKTTFDDEGTAGFKFPLFTGDFRAVYNFTSRLYAGVNAIISSSRVGQAYNMMPLDGIISSDYFSRTYRVPGYFDLGLLAGYKLNRKLGVWLESGNLLCETIQRSPYYSKKDLWITAGITLNL